jgi:tetratricopeptide (TPR) repeat protein
VKNVSDIQETIEKARKLKTEHKFEESLELLEVLLEQEPDSKLIKETLIDTLFAYGGYLNDDYVLEFDKAVHIFKRLIEIDPNNYRGYYNLGIAFFNLGLFEEALHACNQAIHIKPDYEHCYYNIGLIYEAQDDFKRALYYYNKALDLDPNFAYALHSKEILKKQIDFLDVPEEFSEKTVICDNCGNRNRTDAKFCDNCGIRLND